MDGVISLEGETVVMLISSLARPVLCISELIGLLFVRGVVRGARVMFSE